MPLYMIQSVFLHPEYHAASNLANHIKSIYSHIIGQTFEKLIEFAATVLDFMSTMDKKETNYKSNFELG